jgi:hypothetical protein
MSLIIATHQPNYIPWLGYFYKLSQTDIFVFLDDVQFSKTGAHNYHYIKTPEGSLKLKIPVTHKFVDSINNVKTNDHGGWKQRHLDELEKHYKTAPYFNQIIEDFRKVLMVEYDNLSDLNVAIILFIADKFGITPKIVFSSSLGLESRSEQKIIDVCSALNATAYYSGRGAMAYQEEENFSKEGIELIYDTFTPVEYPQMYDEFQKNVTVLDFLMNHGYNWEYYKELLKNNGIV